VARKIQNAACARSNIAQLIHPAAFCMVAIGVGLHYGMAAFGPSGDEQTIIGDTVNVASRLERLTRRLDTAMAVSDEILRAVSERDGASIRSRLRSVGVVRLPGCGPRRVWIAPPFPHSKS
jgi:adenylate cyclase